MKKHLLCGIDVGSKELAVAVDPGTGRVWEGVFANDATGQRDHAAGRALRTTRRHDRAPMSGALRARSEAQQVRDLGQSHRANQQGRQPAPYPAPLRS